MAPEHAQRKLTTILAADVEGYTRLMRADEEATFGTLTGHREIIDHLIARHNGRIFSTGGDSVLAEFGSAVEAVRCAISIQEELRVCNAELPDDRRMQFRIGINVGDVMVKDDDLFGDGVNVAARLESLAVAGGVCISGSVFDQVKHKLSFGFEDMGAQEVKNIAEPVSAFQVVAGPVSVATPAKTDLAMKRWQMPALAASMVIIAVAAGAAWWQPWAPDVEPTSVSPKGQALIPKPRSAAGGPETIEEFVAQEEKRVQEASGGAALNGRIYVVDDEKPDIYEYKYSPQHKKAIFLEKYRIRDARKEAGIIREKHVEKVHDLEGVASYKRHLYVVTSHSLTKKDNAKKKRELLLQIGKFEKLADGDTIARVSNATSLTNAIHKSLAGLTKRNTKLIETENRWNIEGFGIDPSGTAYFGFRNPLLKIDNQAYAIVLSANLERLFSGKAILKPILLRLEHSGQAYGIGSLEFDRGSLFILGRSPKNRVFLAPKLWKLTPTDAKIQEPVLVKNWSLKLPPRFQAMAEALVLPPNSRQGFIFLDAEGHGGQRVYGRAVLGAMSRRRN
jgi:class 3 adenylate cyclase